MTIFFVTGYSEEEALILRKFCVSFNITAMCQVHSALKLLFHVSKVLGFAPYTLLDNGVLVPSRAAKIYSIFLCICLMAAKGDVFAIMDTKNTLIPLPDLCSSIRLLA